MQFELQKALPVLERTPQVVESLLYGLPDEWIHNNEGGDTWTPFEIVAHLIHGEKTDWIPRAQVILGEGNKEFVPFDMKGHIKEGKGKTLSQLLDEFKILRKENLAQLQALGPTEEMLDLTGIHPSLGTVTLRHLLASWVVHDLTHIHQLSRVMAKQYSEAVGPWKQFMGVLGGKR
ncbi:DinB family protein [Niastella caeni]|uniref:DinB family protein n=1 Tax=Niastella caeni TaxID=2569763 RepID=A0A4S8HRE6_9BACT|nr:DinB family protein [Niastella caeni]THU38003.1 DinB family protein [Niastella caeni]